MDMVAYVGLEDTNSDDEIDPKEVDSQFKCYICLGQASEAVVTTCGHLYCWPCIYMWMRNQSQCPVCKERIDNNKIIPLYLCGSQRKSKLNIDVPPRPKGHRTGQ